MKTFDRPVWSVLGVPIDVLTLDEAVAKVRAGVEMRTPLSFVTPNLNWLVRALRDRQAMRQVREADLSLADGAPIVWLARQLGAPITERVAGSDLFERLRQRVPGQRPIRVFFFGGRDGAADKANAALNAEGGGLIGCGALNPGYGTVASMSAPVIIDTINAARPDFIVVALGAAKGQAWISANRHRLSAPVIAHLGAVVDFTAGTIPRAPGWMARSGLEWLWRIKAEPSLFARYWSDGWALTGLVAGRLRAHKARLSRLETRGEARADRIPEARGQRILLSGDHVGGDLAALRSAFRAALEAEGDVTLDVAKLGRLDGQVLALVGLLHERLMRSGRALRLAGARDEIAALMQAELGPESLRHENTDTKTQDTNTDLPRSMAS